MITILSPGKKKKPLAKLKLDQALKKVAENTTATNANSAKFSAILSSVLYEIARQVEHQEYALSISDRDLAEKFGLSPSQSKRVRARLKAYGIIFFPESTRQKKPGDYPLWMVTQDFLKWIGPVSLQKKPVAPARRTYIPQYYIEVKQAKQATRTWLNSYGDVRIDLISYRCLIYQELDRRLALQGLTRQDFKR